MVDTCSWHYDEFCQHCSDRFLSERFNLNLDDLQTDVFDDIPSSDEDDEDDDDLSSITPSDMSSDDDDGSGGDLYVHVFVERVEPDQMHVIVYDPHFVVERSPQHHEPSAPVMRMTIPRAPDADDEDGGEMN